MEERKTLKRAKLTDSLSSDKILSKEEKDDSSITTNFFP